MQWSVLLVVRSVFQLIYWNGICIQNSTRFLFFFFFNLTVRKLNESLSKYRSWVYSLSVICMWDVLYQQPVKRVLRILEGIFSGTCTHWHSVTFTVASSGSISLVCTREQRYKQDLLNNSRAHPLTFYRYNLYYTDKLTVFLHLHNIMLLASIYTTIPQVFYEIHH